MGVLLRMSCVDLQEVCSFGKHTPGVGPKRVMESSVGRSAPWSCMGVHVVCMVLCSFSEICGLLAALLTGAVTGKLYPSAAGRGGCNWDG